MPQHGVQRLVGQGAAQMFFCHPEMVLSGGGMARGVLCFFEGLLRHDKMPLGAVICFLRENKTKLKQDCCSGKDEKKSEKKNPAGECIITHQNPIMPLFSVVFLVSPVIIGGISVTIADMALDINIGQGKGQSIELHIRKLLDSAHDDFPRGFVP